MKRKRMRTENLRESQCNPENIHTDSGTVQFWRNGIMLTAMMTVEDAKEMVREGKGFVIASQAIGSIDEDGFLNA